MLVMELQVLYLTMVQVYHQQMELVLVIQQLRLQLLQPQLHHQLVEAVEAVEAEVHQDHLFPVLVEELF